MFSQWTQNQYELFDFLTAFWGEKCILFYNGKMLSTDDNLLPFH